VRSARPAIGIHIGYGIVVPEDINFAKKQFYTIRDFSAHLFLLTISSPDAALKPARASPERARNFPEKTADRVNVRAAFPLPAGMA
jgi:hypothetical protein